MVGWVWVLERVGLDCVGVGRWFGFGCELVFFYSVILWISLSWSKSLSKE